MFCAAGPAAFAAGCGRGRFLGWVVVLLPRVLPSGGVPRSMSLLRRPDENNCCSNRLTITFGFGLSPSRSPIASIRIGIVGEQRRRCNRDRTVLVDYEAAVIVGNGRQRLVRSIKHDVDPIV